MARQCSIPGRQASSQRDIITLSTNKRWRTWRLPIERASDAFSHCFDHQQPPPRPEGVQRLSADVKSEFRACLDMILDIEHDHFMALSNTTSELGPRLDMIHRTMDHVFKGRTFATVPWIPSIVTAISYLWCTQPISAMLTFFESEREIMCLLETKGSSCKRASPCQPAATEPVDVLGPMRIGGL